MWLKEPKHTAERMPHVIWGSYLLPTTYYLLPTTYRGEDAARDLPRGAARLGAGPWAAVHAVAPGWG